MMGRLLQRLLRSVASSVVLVCTSVLAVVLFGFMYAPPAVPPSGAPIGKMATRVSSAPPATEAVLVSAIEANGADARVAPLVSRLVDRWLAIDPRSPQAALARRRIAAEAHLALVPRVDDDLDAEKQFPSANACATCHPKHYAEWSVSQHAYAQLSPVFNAFQGTVGKLSNGTNGDFCIRCHTPVGMNIGEPTFMSNMDRHPTSREGITCIVCHRLKNPFGKVSGRLAIVEGDLFNPVYGSRGDSTLQVVIESPDYNVNTERGKTGRTIHVDAVKFAQIDKPGFCGTCHDVNFVNGFRLEEAFSEFKATPASKRGVSCQDCHMGKVQGVDAGYESGPAAIIGGRPAPPRKKITSHYFAGPDYSIVHPAVFPHNVRAADFASIREWLTFDVDAGWGTDAFEDTVSADYPFPEKWQFADDRYDARDIINDNLGRLATIEEKRHEVMRAGFKLSDIQVDRARPDGIAFRVEVTNGTDGHNVPTGFDAERVLFLHVTVTDADGSVVFVSGDRDPNGDIRDLHSLYVHNGELPPDPYLFSLQSNFITRMIQGGEREQVLAVNFSPSPLPFLRPSTSSTVLLGRPTAVRKHRRTIAPHKSKWAKYEVTAGQLRGTHGPYKVNVKLVAQMVPVNLLHEIQDVGFDYYMSPREVADRIVAGAMTLYDEDAEIDVR